MEKNLPVRNRRWPRLAKEPKPIIAKHEKRDQAQTFHTKEKVDVARVKHATSLEHAASFEHATSLEQAASLAHADSKEHVVTIEGPVVVAKAAASITFILEDDISEDSSGDEIEIYSCLEDRTPNTYIINLSPGYATLKPKTDTPYTLVGYKLTGPYNPVMPCKVANVRNISWLEVSPPYTSSSTAPYQPVSTTSSTARLNAVLSFMGRLHLQSPLVARVTGGTTTTAALNLKQVSLKSAAIFVYAGPGKTFETESPTTTDLTIVTLHTIYECALTCVGKSESEASEVCAKAMSADAVEILVLACKQDAMWSYYDPFVVEVLAQILHRAIAGTNRPRLESCISHDPNTYDKRNGHCKIDKLTFLLHTLKQVRDKKQAK